MKKERRVTGVMVQYYHTCERELWYFGNGINLNQEDENILIGRQIQEEYYQEGKKDLLIDGMISVDMLEDGKTLVEIKKSSKLEEPAKQQLKYYLWYLKRKKGVQAKGVMAYPEERKRNEVQLTEEDQDRFEDLVEDIRNIIDRENPPPPDDQPFCQNCSYYDLCRI